MKMMMRFVVLSALAMAMILLAIPQPASADIYMKQKQHTDATQIMGMSQPARDTIVEIWITEKGFRSDDPAHSSILLGKEQKIIMIDHAAKTYMEQPMNMSDMMAEMGKDKSPQERAAMNKMMQGMMKMDVSVQETPETKTINKWKCRKYLVTITSAMGPMNTEVWATEDLKVDKKIYDQFASRMFSAMPGMQGSMESMKKEMEKIKGVQVMTVSSIIMMGQPQKTTTELLEFKDAKAPADIFAIPAGYKKQAR